MAKTTQPPDEEELRKRRERKKERDRYRRTLFNINERRRKVKRDARKNKRVVTIGDDEIERIVQEDCVYCGTPALYGPWQTHGIDRVDNSLHYVPGNCATCCTLCNFMKNTQRVELFLAQAERITIHQSRKPFLGAAKKSDGGDYQCHTP